MSKCRKTKRFESTHLGCIGQPSKNVSLHDNNWSAVRLRYQVESTKSGGGGGELSHLSCRIARSMSLAIVTSRAVSPGKFKMAALGDTKISSLCDDHWKNWQQSD